MKHEESKIQAEIVKELRRRGYLIFSVSNDSGGDSRRMGTYITLGLLPGVPDLIIALPGRVMGLEVKSPTGKQGPKQIAFQAKWEALGHKYFVVRSLDETLKILDTI
jgi:hypothetical protein